MRPRHRRRGAAPLFPLTAYAVDDDGTRMYLATLRSTRKFRNLAENPAVSLLVDTREALPQARALTIEGTCRPLAGPGCEHARALLLDRHPHLVSLLDDADGELLCVQIASSCCSRGLPTRTRSRSNRVPVDSPSRSSCSILEDGLFRFPRR